MLSSSDIRLECFNEDAFVKPKRTEGKFKIISEKQKESSFLKRLKELIDLQISRDRKKIVRGDRRDALKLDHDEFKLDFGGFDPPQDRKIGYTPAVDKKAEILTRYEKDQLCGINRNNRNVSYFNLRELLGYMDSERKTETVNYKEEDLYKFYGQQKEKFGADGRRGPMLFTKDGFFLDKDQHEKDQHEKDQHEKDQHEKEHEKDQHKRELRLHKNASRFTSSWGAPFGRNDSNIRIDKDQMKALNKTADAGIQYILSKGQQL